MKILAIDPGYDRLGWAVGQMKSGQLEVIDCGLIQTSKDLSLTERCLQLDQELSKIIATNKPTQLAIETLFFAQNRKTALAVSQSRGVILNTCARQGLKIFEYNPGQIKQTVTGYGRADKKAISKMVELELKIKTTRMVDDVVDALAILITHTATNRHIYD